MIFWFIFNGIYKKIVSTDCFPFSRDNLVNNPESLYLPYGWRGLKIDEEIHLNETEEALVHKK